MEGDGGLRRRFANRNSRVTRDTDHFVALLKDVPVQELRTTIVRRVPLLAMIDSAEKEKVTGSLQLIQRTNRGVVTQLLTQPF